MRVYVATPGLHIRAKASKNSKSLDEASYGEELLLLSGKQGDLWIKVKYLKRGAVGYVNSKNVFFDIPTPPLPAPKPEPYDYTALWVSGGLLVAGLVALFIGGWL